MVVTQAVCAMQGCAARRRLPSGSTTARGTEGCGHCGLMLPSRVFRALDAVACGVLQFGQLYRGSRLEHHPAPPFSTAPVALAAPAVTSSVCGMS